MEAQVARCAGLDVHKDEIVACARIAERPGGPVRVELHTFGATTRELLALRDWLTALGVTRVGMESTGVYWKPVFHMLEDAVAECWLVNARHMSNVPGRKTDAQDAAWIAELVEHGLVRPSFVPPQPIRELRDLTRYRKAQTEERTREAQRLDKVLQDAGVKLSSVASDPLGVSGRAMLQALVAGTTDPTVLADLARGRLRRKLPALQEALNGFFTGHHAILVREILAKLDYLDEAIDRLSTEIDRVIAPFEPKVALLDTIPGVDRRTAECLIAEIGVDMTVFGRAERLASWAGRCPGQYESAGKSKGGKTRKGSKWLRLHLHEAARAASTTKGTYLSAQYKRIKPRRGAAKARVAVEHSILVAIYHMLDRDEPYHDLGADYFTRRQDPARHAQRLTAQLNALGYDAVITRRTDQTADAA
ncbi:IS110 family transposase [Frankia sp. Cpl3]|nr:IS110 family transposase [Frankia sp. Cpl3]